MNNINSPSMTRFAELYTTFLFRNLRLALGQQGGSMVRDLYLKSKHRDCINVRYTFCGEWIRSLGCKNMSKYEDKFYTSVTENINKYITYTDGHGFFILNRGARDLPLTAFFDAFFKNTIVDNSVKIDRVPSVS